HMLVGFVKPSAGEGVVAGISTALDSFRIKDRVGYVAGTIPLPLRPTPREVFLQIGEVHAIPPQELERRVEALVATFELEQLMNQPLARLRPEQRQRFTLARALLNDPPVLILDEPAHMPELMRGDLLRLALRAESNAGKAVLVATRSSSVAACLCHRVLLMDQGLVLERGGVVEVSA
ncbi:MAG TPA: ATP-binding cassette domain-containing protein, partial [Hyalangium sp.]|nr:ATP-binding cassette domain-containing protein [Hyalangium sp.]